MKSKVSTMCPKFSMIIMVLGVIFANTHAAVIRCATEKMMIAAETQTEEITTEQMEATTLEAITEESASTDVPEPVGALSKDEEATILVIDQTLLDPAPADVKVSEAPSANEQRFGKLLLLSTPKLDEKPKIPEENFEESEELMDSSENKTVAADAKAEEEATTVSATEEPKEDEKKEDSSKTKDAIPTTKLFPINDTLYEANSKASDNAPAMPVPAITVMGEDSKDSDKAAEAPEPAVILVEDEQHKEEKSSNLNAVILAENEADYVLFDADTEIIEEGVYADVNSELHLQPIVQSVEIVPSSVDDSLLVDYVHHW
uniref:Uncharacterized protein n=1 Tax=Stomoxys calcitrans TaxID=35570 RepID=A0A1I8NWH4_STOCA